MLIILRIGVYTYKGTYGYNIKNRCVHLLGHVCLYHIKNRGVHLLGHICL